MTITIGQTLGRYKIEALQGSGGMAKVYKAWDPNTGRHIAIKILRQQLVDEAGFTERFGREGQLIASLNHQNIVSIYDFDRQETDTETIHYMVMPFVAGPTLKDKLAAQNEQDKYLPLSEVARIIEGVAAALDYAHAKDMVHRDIKPGNILFDEHEKPLLADFGLARLTFGERITQTGATSGTPAYMSPEQALGEPGDNRSDIYSLGIILHELLTNELPFSADSGLGLLMKHINDPLPAPSEIVPELSPAIEAVVFRATSKDPASRFQSAGEMATELRTAIESDVVSQDTLRLSQLVQQPDLQRGYLRWLVAAGIVSLFIMFSFVIVGILSNEAAPTPTPTLEPVRSMVAGAVPFSTSFAEDDEFNEGWPISEEGILTSAIEDGAYIVRYTGPGLADSVIFSPEYYQYSALVAETTATLSEDSQPDSGFGIVFRYVDDNNYYVFAVNGQRQVSMWALEDGNWRELRGETDLWMNSDHVNPPGEPNELSVSARGDKLTGIINGAIVIDLEDDTFSEGGVGIYIATTIRRMDGVLAEVSYDRYSVTSAVPSMTNQQ